MRVVVFFVAEQILAQLRVDRDVTGDDVFRFLASHLQGIFRAAIFSEHLRLFHRDNLAYPQSGVETNGEDGLVAGIAQDFEEVADLGLG